MSESQLVKTRYDLIEFGEAAYIRKSGEVMPYSELLRLHKKLGETLARYEGLSSSDVVRMAAVEYTRRVLKTAKLHFPKNRKGLFGLSNGVYFVGYGGLTKIGVTRSSLAQRTGGIARDICADKRDVWAQMFIQTTEPLFPLEQGLHVIFEHKQSSGEWYRLDESDFEYIKGLASC